MLVRWQQHVGRPPRGHARATVPKLTALLECRPLLLWGRLGPVSHWSPPPPGGGIHVNLHEFTQIHVNERGPLERTFDRPPERLLQRPLDRPSCGTGCRCGGSSTWGARREAARAQQCLYWQHFLNLGRYFCGAASARFPTGAPPSGGRDSRKFT